MSHFSALDEELKEKLLADVKILLKEEKITTIVITHNIKEAFQLSDKIAFSEVIKRLFKLILLIIYIISP